MMTRFFALCIPLAVTATLGSSLAAATFGPGDSLDGGTDPFVAMMQVNAAVDKLEVQLRDHGDLASVLELAPDLLNAVPGHTRLRRLHAAALAAQGARMEALLALADVAGDDGLVWEHIATALLAREQGDAAGADRAIEAALVLEPGNAYALNVAGTLAAAKGDFGAAADAFAAAAAAAPEAASYHGNLGGALLQVGAVDRAREAFDRALVLAPFECGVLSMRAAARMQLGMAAEAAADLQACLEADPAQGRALAARLVQAHLAAGNVSAASSAIDRHLAELDDAAMWQSEVALRRGDAAAARVAIARLPVSSVDTVLRRIYTDLVDGDLQAARNTLAASGADGPELRRLRIALDENPAEVGDAPETPLEHFLAALAASAAGDRERATAQLDAAAEAFAGFTSDGIDPLTLAIPETGSDLAVATVLLLRDLIVPARERLALAGTTQMPLAAYLSGQAAKAAGDHSAGHAAFSAAMKGAPGFRAALLELAEMQMASGNGPAALEHFATASAIRPSPAISLRIGVISDALGDKDSALAAYEALLAQAPDNYLANNQLAWFMVANGGDLDRAMQLARRADALRPGNASVIDTIGWIHFLEGDYDRAATRLAEAFAASHGRSADIRYHLARAELARGNIARAVELAQPIAGEGAAESPAALAAMLLEEARKIR